MHIHSQHSAKEGRQDRMEQKLRYHYQYHHNHPSHHYPPTLTDEEVGGGKGGRTSENSVTLTRMLPVSHRFVHMKNLVTMYGNFCKQMLVFCVQPGSSSSSRTDRCAHFQQNAGLRLFARQQQQQQDRPLCPFPAKCWPTTVCTHLNCARHR